MNTQEFMKQLNNVQELISKGRYKDAIILIEKLKEIEKECSFDYSLTHRLYQLDSNSRSLYNQQILLKAINSLSKKRDVIDIKELNRYIKENDKLDLNDDILRREIEILILRNLLSCRIDGGKLIF
jgi:hypothetical protein